MFFRSSRLWQEKVRRYIDNEEVILTQISRDVVCFYCFQIQEQVFCVLWIGVSFQHRCRCGWYATSAKLHLRLQQALLFQLVIDVTTVSQEINHQYSTPNKSVLYFVEVAQFKNDQSDYFALLYYSLILRTMWIIYDFAPYLQLRLQIGVVKNLPSLNIQLESLLENS